LVLFISRYTKTNKSLLDLLDHGIFPTLHVKSIPLYLSKILDQMFRILSTLNFIEHINGKPITVKHILVNTDDKLSSHGWDNHGCLELTHIEKNQSRCIKTIFRGLS
jgi:hypothetical protein